jgi:periplasmic protein TonB
MSAETLSLVWEGRESLRGPLLASLLFHSVLLGLTIGYGLVGLRSGPRWGNPWAQGSSTRINAVASLPGVPLPAPLLATPNTLANENPGLYQTQPETPAKPEPAEEIPRFQDAVKEKQPERINRRIQTETVIPPANAIPFGAGGQPALSYSQFTAAMGEGGISIGEGDFGTRYGWYVDAVRNRVSENWLLSTISPSVITAPRLYVEFEILRDGTISNVKLMQSSGNSEVDRSALRAIEASSPLGALPSDYSGSRVSVSFYFDFRRP